MGWSFLGLILSLILIWFGIGWGYPLALIFFLWIILGIPQEPPKIVTP